MHYGLQGHGWPYLWVVPRRGRVAPRRCRNFGQLYAQKRSCFALSTRALMSLPVEGKMPNEAVSPCRGGAGPSEVRDDSSPDGGGPDPKVGLPHARKAQNPPRPRSTPWVIRCSPRQAAGSRWWKRVPGGKSTPFGIAAHLPRGRGGVVP